jgi:hypothetical protein
VATLACTISGSIENGSTPTADRTGAETYLGDYVAQNGYFFAALEVQDPATPMFGATVKPGTRLIAIKTIIGNQTGKRLLFSDSDVTLLDADGIGFDAAGGIMARGVEIGIVFLDPGERVQGWIPYYLPQEAVPAQLEYGIGVAAKPVVRLGLIPPPAGHKPWSVDTSRTPPKLPKLGEDAKGEEFSLRALQVEDPSQTESPNLYQPADGTRFVAVEVKIANIGSSVINSDDFYINLVDANGFVYAVEFFGREGNIPSDDIEPDSSVQGWVSFTIPEGARLESIKWTPDIFKPSVWAGLLK